MMNRRSSHFNREEAVREWAAFSLEKRRIFLYILSNIVSNIKYNINKGVRCMKHKTIQTEVKSEMILISGGTFQMGSNNGRDNEKPVHTVTVASFYMSKYPVTNKEYTLYKPEAISFESKPAYPVNCVNWYNAVEYCNWLSDRDGLSRCYRGSGDNIKMDLSKNGYRLPTEAEWEYACRAGTTTEYYWGDKMDGDYCWYLDNPKNWINPVGQKNANSFGLYDMSGNVWEWCWDLYDKDYYKNSPSKNPTGPSSGSGRVERVRGWTYLADGWRTPKVSPRAVVIRGGSWDSGAEHCRSAGRSYFTPVSTRTCNNVGFRPVRRAQ